MAIDWDRLVVAPLVRTTIFGDRVCYGDEVGTFEIAGVFDEAYIELTPLGRGGIDTENFNLGSPGAITGSMPVLGVQLSQFHREPRQGGVLMMLTGLHKGERFEVKEVRPDGHGWAKLLLNEFLPG
jgi:hypothetical protein